MSPWHKYCFVHLTIWYILPIWCNTIIQSKRKSISGNYIMCNYLIINYIIFIYVIRIFIYKREKRNSKHFAHRFVPACFVTIFTFKFNNNILYASKLYVYMYYITYYPYIHIILFYLHCYKLIYIHLVLFSIILC